MRLSSVLAFAALACAGPLTAGADRSGAFGPSHCDSNVLTIASNGDVRIAYRTAGSKGNKPLLLIAGSGMQLTDWPETFVQALVRSGHYVIAADPRDSGCSSHLDTLGLPDWPAIFSDLGAGKRPALPYSVRDMVADQLAVLDAEGIAAPQVLGVSGGSVVAEVMAISHPERVGSLTLLMANAGNPARRIPARPDKLAAVSQPPPAPASKDEIIQYLSALESALSPNTASDAQALRERVRLRVDRGYTSDGVQRQGAALATTGDLREALGALRVPTIVIHGEMDPLIPPASGEDVAKAIPGAKFVSLPLSGHGLDSAMFDAALAATSALKAADQQ